VSSKITLTQHNEYNSSKTWGSLENSARLFHMFTFAFDWAL